MTINKIQLKQALEYAVALSGEPQLSKKGYSDGWVVNKRLLDAKALIFKKRKNEQTYKQYADAVAGAANYLLDKDERKNNQSRFDYIELHVRNLAKYAETYKQGWVPKPDFIAQNSSSYQKTPDKKTPRKKTFGQITKAFAAIEKSLPRDAEVSELLKSQQFLRLKNYLEQTLKNDQRNHSYLCETIQLKVNKAPAMERLINNINEAKKIKDLVKVIGEFVDGEGQPGSDYEIINKGQNFTTRFFGLQTTSMKLINDFITLVLINGGLPNLAEECSEDGISY